MYEIKRSERTVNGKPVETWIAEIVSANILEVEVGTTGYMGGDTGHGGRTFIKLKDLASTDMSANIVTDTFGQADEVQIAFGGDTELSSVIEALKFALTVLEEQSK